MKIAVLSNINLDLLINTLSKNFEVYKPEGFGRWAQEILNPHSDLFHFKPECVFLIIDAEELVRGQEGYDNRLNELDNNISYIENAIRCSSEITFFVSNFDFPLKKLTNMRNERQERLIEHCWHEKLLQMNAIYNNFYIFELKNIVEQIGRDNFYSQKLWYAGGIKYSLKAEKKLEKEIKRTVKALTGNRKKCLVLDLDNTLWGRVLGEEGLEGIELSEFKEGARYKDFQKRIKEIKETGIILAVVSKNNVEDVDEVFEKHPHMVLKKTDFVSMKVNWEIKTKNILELSEELNLGLDSFVFIDDNPIERESVKKGLPQVTVPDFPDDTSKLENFITEIYYDHFFNLNFTEEDQNKTIIYQQSKEREELRKQSKSYKDFLETLNTKILVWKAKSEDVSRITQLVQKTNQFNLTTRRYSEKEIKNFLSSDNYSIFVASVKDKFGDNGKVSVIILDDNNGEAHIDTFILSCRVMGRYIEDQLIDFIENEYLEKGYNILNAYYNPTKKNKPVAELYERLGYQVVQRDDVGNKMYKIDLMQRDTRKRKGVAQLIIVKESSSLESAVQFQGK